MKYSLNIYMNRLFEIDLLRVFCIFLLVAFHSFSIYTGSWSEPHGLQFIPAYYWIGKFCYSFMLPLWVFISGFLWGYQVIEQKRIQTLKQLAKKKAQKFVFLMKCMYFCTRKVERLCSVRDLAQLVSARVWGA